LLRLAIPRCAVHCLAQDEIDDLRRENAALRQEQHKKLKKAGSDLSLLAQTRRELHEKAHKSREALDAIRSTSISPVAGKKAIRRPLSSKLNMV
jgi:predicted  nucleic acid-binding Zn-ribbon protein